MPINNIKSVEGNYMKINELTTQKTNVKREVQRERPVEGNVNKAENQEVAPKDKVEIAFSQVVDRAVNKSKELPEIREEKVARVREAIEKGTYQVSNRDLARAMLRSLLTEIG